MIDLTVLDDARGDLVALAYAIDRAPDLDAASQAYFLARRRFYELADIAQADDGVRHAWAQVVDVYRVALDRFATPIEPLVVFG